MQQTLRVAVLISAVIVLNAFDLAYTLFAHHIGMLDEINPLAQPFLNAGLTTSLIAFKILMLSSGLLLLWRLRLSRWAPPACWVLVIAYVGLSVIWYQWVRDVNYIYETQAAVAVPNIYSSP
jgi:hypothetical protein